MMCACGGDYRTETRALRMEPEGETPVVLSVAEVLVCFNCGFMKPTEETRRTLFGLLGIDPDGPLPKRIRVFWAPVAEPQGLEEPLKES